MKKLKVVGILAVVETYLSEKNADESEEIFVVPVHSDELFISSEGGT